MDIDQPSPQLDATQSLASAQNEASGSGPMPTPIAGPSRLRTLRARPSDPAPSSSTTKQAGPSTAPPANLRQPSQKELENIYRRLGAEGVAAKREELIVGKEQELKGVVDGHDTATREKFHLERFVTLLEGWDPAYVHAKQNGNVKLISDQWKDARHNLLNLLPQSAVVPSSHAGPSRRPRTSLPARTTRRAAHEQSEVLANVVAPQTPVTPHLTNGHGTSGKGKGKAVEAAAQSTPGSVKGKGRARVLETETEQRMEDDAIIVAATNAPPSNFANKKGAKASRRKTLGEPLVQDVIEDVVEVVDSGEKGKKRGRKSLPNLRPAKKLRESGRKSAVREMTDDASSLVDTPIEDTPIETAPEPPQDLAPAPLPSLAHLPFPPPPKRTKERHPGPRTAWYTDPHQRPLAQPKYEGDVSRILHSYTHIEDTGHQPDQKALDLRAAKEGYYRARVVYLQRHGRLQRLLDEVEDSGSGTGAQRQKTQTLPARKTDYQDSLMAHMMQVRNAMMNEAKWKPVVCKRIARMIQLYWERLEGKEERERLAEEREKKKQAKDLVKAIRKRWALAVKIVRAKVLEAQKVEQDRLGKEYLQNMLQRSTGFLEAQVAGDEDEDDNEESDDEDSERTDDESPAEDSEGEGDDDLAQENGEGLDHEDGAARLASSLAPTSSPGPAEDMSQDEESDDSGDDLDDLAEEGEVDLRMLLSDGIDMDDQLSTELQTTTTATASSAIEVEVETSEILSTRPAGIVEATTSNVLAQTPSSMDVDAEVEPVQSPNDIAEHEVRTSGQITSLPISVSTSAAPPRSRRLRKIASITPMPHDEDPDANDIEFEAAPTSDLDEQDAELDVEMEDADEAGDEEDSEDEGLLADADIPIEELMKRYGHPEQQDEVATGHVKEVDANGVKEKVHTDKSLMDDVLPDMPVSPQFVIEGKRQRRARAVWSPDDISPVQALKRPKVEEVESTPEPSSEEEDDDEDDEDGEEGDVDAGEDAQADGDKTEEDTGPRVRPPFLLRGTLRPYQQAGLEWLASLYANKMNGILADEMGLGKTIQTISLLGHLACDKGVWGQHLIIVPTSVILNWEMEFKKFLPGMKVLTYYGNQKERKEKRVGWHTENAWQVCITSYQIVLADQHIFRRKNWVYMILDEAHNIKNFRSQRWQTLLGFKAQRRLLLTGTPLQNNLMELWSLLYFLMPGGVGEQVTAVVGFANHKEFMEWFSNPMDKAVESGDAMDEATLETVAKLHTLLRPFILRRLKAEVEKQLPGKFEHVVYCRLSKRQRFLYDEFMSRSSTREALSAGGYLGVMNTLMQLRKVCNHPDLFEVRPVRTSFAMNSVAADYEPRELLVRRRMLELEDEKRVDVLALGLAVTAHEGVSGWKCNSTTTLDASDRLPYALEPVAARRGRAPAGPKMDTQTVEGWTRYRAWTEEQRSIGRWRSLRDVNRRRCSTKPIYGSTFLSMLTDLPRWLLPFDVTPRRDEIFAEYRPPASKLIVSLPNRAKSLESVMDLFAVIPPNVVARDLPNYALPGLQPISHPSLLDTEFDTLHRSTVKLQIAFPDSSLLQYDCGKLQKLWEMLRELKAGGHRVLIFTQMTKVLDILEIFLSYNGHRYLRLDGSTKIEDRQIITERFNSDPRIFVFIASSRSGGVGINLTGADTVFFYDSDWNPSMDRQCMDRAHRIGQTREVHIYRFVSKFTVEENMLKKANQKRLLDRVVIQEGGFTNDWWGRVGWKDMFGDVTGDPAQAQAQSKIENNEEGQDGAQRDQEDVMDVDVDRPADKEAEKGEIVDIDLEPTPIAEDVEVVRPRIGEEREFARALAQVEDEEDVQAARMAQGEGELDLQEFTEGPGQSAGAGASAGGSKNARLAELVKRDSASATPAPARASSAMLEPEQRDIDNGEGVEEGEGEGDGEGEYDENEPGGVEDFMLSWVEADWEWFAYYKA